MSDDKMMTLEEFETAVSERGGDLARWPEAAQARAAQLVAASPEAEATLAAYQGMEADLATARAAPPPSLPEALTARILADAASAAPSPASAAPEAVLEAAPGGGLLAFLDRFIPAWRPAAACAASAALGVWIGYLSPQDIAEAANAMTSFEAAEEFAALDFADDFDGGGMEFGFAPHGEWE